MKIYTKTGDQGMTSNVLGERISKGGLMLELQGTIDEVNAGIGYLRALLQNTRLDSQRFNIDDALKNVQYTLFRIGSDVSSGFAYGYVKENDITALEQGIDSMTEAAGTLNSFIYYSGHSAAAYCQVLRSIVRRAERVFVRHLENGEYNLNYQYINRLSDYFFALARYINYLTNTEEEKIRMR